MKIVRKLPRSEEPTSLYFDRQLHELLSGFKKAIEKHNTSAVIVIDGRSGMGKTTLGNQVGVMLDKKFDLNKIHYTPTTFLEGSEDKIGLANAKAGDCLMFDEAMLISNRSALSHINRMIIQAMSMIRSKRLYIIFCVNSIFDLDRNLAISRADLLLHVYGESLIHRGRFGAFFRGRDGQDRLKTLYLLGKKMYNYSKPRANLIGRFTKEFVVDEKQYEKQKQIGVNSFLKGTETSMTKKAFASRNRLINYLIREEKWDIPKMMEISGLGRTQIYNIMSNGAENPQSTV